MAIRTYQKDNLTLYEIYVQTPDPRTGKRLQKRVKGFSSKLAAQREEIRLKAELLNLAECPLPKTWSAWHRHCIDVLRPQLTKATMMDYEGRITKWVNPIWGERRLDEITPNDCHELLFQKIEGITIRTKVEVLKLLKRMLQMAVDEGVINGNPALKIKMKVPESKQSVLNATEVEVFLREAANLNHRFYEVWVLALMTGMRSGELFTLKWTDIDLEMNKIFVTRSWSSKNGEGSTKSAQNRVVPISRELSKFLKELKLRSQNSDDFVLPRLEEWRAGAQAQVTRDFCKAIGITPIKFHDLRATFITQLLLNGCPLAKVMAVVGHRHIKTTNVYLRVAGADLNGVTDGLNFALPVTNSRATVLKLERPS